MKLKQEHWAIGEDGDVDVFLFPNDKGGTVNAYLGIYQENKFLGSIEGAELRRLVKVLRPYADARNEDEAEAARERGIRWALRTYQALTLTDQFQHAR